jgi:hypothetical protein
MAGDYVLYDNERYDIMDDRDSIEDLIETNDFDVAEDPKRYIVYQKIGYLRTDGVKFHPLKPKKGAK